LPDRPLRIALLVKALPLHRPGGLENHAWALALGLVRGGNRVTVVTSTCEGGEEQSRLDGVDIVHLRGTAPGRNSLSLFNAFSRWVRLFDGEFDVFHAQGFAALRVRTPKTPLVTTVHGTVWSETPLARQVWPLLRPGEKAAALWRFAGRTLIGPFVHAAWNRSTRILCDSEFTRGELLRVEPRWGTRIDVVPLGVDLPPCPERGPLAKPIHLLAVGRVERVRGLEDLLLALARGANREHFHLTIAGDGPDRCRLEAMARALGLSEAVSLAGRVDEDTLRSLWREADLFVNPEWSQPAFGLVSVEAMGQGLPVMGTPTGATPEIVTPQTGWLVPPRAVDLLAGGLEALAANPGELRVRSAACRRRAEEFTVERMVQGTAASYLRALGRWPF
jgi:glycosyltransferase involved in cell wall biosynthesis